MAEAWNPIAEVYSCRRVNAGVEWGQCATQVTAWLMGRDFRQATWQNI